MIPDRSWDSPSDSERSGTCPSLVGAHRRLGCESTSPRGLVANLLGNKMLKQFILRRRSGRCDNKDPAISGACAEVIGIK